MEFYPDRLRFDSVTKLLRLADHSLVPRVSELANDRSDLPDKNERRYVQVGTMKTVLGASLHFDAPGDCPVFPAALVFFNVLRCRSASARPRNVAVGCCPNAVGSLMWVMRPGVFVIPHVLIGRVAHLRASRN